MRAANSILGLLLATLIGCAPLPPRVGASSDMAIEWQPSPNFDERRPNWIIIHHTSNDNVDDALRTLTDPARAVSAHYLIARDGKIIQLVDERRRAWHAGASYWGGGSDINSASIGIELDNNGAEPFPETQIAALLTLLRDLSARYEIPATNYLGHADVAPRRKTDPSRYFPWQRLAEHGYGLWCRETVPELPLAFDTRLALAALGYDVADMEAAILAFKLHFVQEDSAPVLTQQDQRLLNCLIREKLTTASRATASDR